MIFVLQAIKNRIDERLNTSTPWIGGWQQPMKDNRVAGLELCAETHCWSFSGKHRPVRDVPAARVRCFLFGPYSRWPGRIYLLNDGGRVCLPVGRNKIAGLVRCLRHCRNKCCSLQHRKPDWPLHSPELQLFLAHITLRSIIKSLFPIKVPCFHHFQI